MNHDTNSLEAAFSLAVAQPSLEAREKFVCSHYGEDKVFLDRLRELLHAYDNSDAFLETTPIPDGTTLPFAQGLAEVFGSLKAEAAGDPLGRYILQEQLGEGGFGVVWMATQLEPVRRSVALKIIKAGMDTREVIARFEQERQALAMMDHPNIAKVFDAGATLHGRPFFVMELVRGVRITDYCDQANLPTSERLKLFIQVCHAVQHAHQKGIIHRDLKPSNILVTLHDGVPVPKVIDFGVAKATQEQRLTDLTLFTQFEQIIGTPLYMSPEQAEMSGLDIDTRSDIYSLGVLLYELLAGRTPFDPQDLMKAGYDGMRRVIREQEPQKPSTYLSTMADDVRTTVAGHRNIEGAKLINSIRGDLDWIVMKALEKDRTRRYETASGLSMDIQRHLAHEPVLARPATHLYRFRRMVRRNKGVFAAAAALVAVLVAGLTVSVWQVIRAVAAEKRVSAVLEDLGATSPAFAAQARTLAAAEQFDEALGKLDYALKLRPATPAYLRAKADLLQCQLRLAEAAVVYRDVLAVVPDDARAKVNAALCDKLLASTADPQKLSRESLVELFSIMQKEQRPAAELMRVGRLLKEERNILVSYWLERLKELPIPPERPLTERLLLGEDGLLTLDLSATKITDLRPLAGMPLGILNCNECPDLADLSPLSGMPLKSLSVRLTRIKDLSPLSTIYSLQFLDMAGTLVTDIAALHGLPLQHLRISQTPISDLSPLRGTPLLRLFLDEAPIEDLTPLANLALKQLSADAIPAHDYTPLAGMPLEICSLQQSKVSNLGFAANMPLRHLALFGSSGVTDLQVLSRIPTLELLGLPAGITSFPAAELAAISALKPHPALQQITTQYLDTGDSFPRDVPHKELFWQFWDKQAQFLDPLRTGGAIVSVFAMPDGTWVLSLQNQPVGDISCLRGAPVSRLLLSGTAVADLSPLKGMPLQVLFIERTRVTNLRPLIGLPLTKLYLSGGVPDMDVRVLAGMHTLQELGLPPNPRHLEALRELPAMEYISFFFDYTLQRPTMTSSQFWDKHQLLWPERLAAQAKFAEAAQLLGERIASNKSADERLDWLRLATMELAAGNHDRYRAACSTMTKRFKNTIVLTVAETTAKVCLLAPDPGVPAAEISTLLDSAAAMDRDKGLRAWYHLTRALQEFRSGQWNKAAEHLTEVTTWPAAEASGAALLAMISHHQNKPDTAAIELTSARERILPQWPEAAENPDWMVAHLLFAEAETLIDGRVSDQTLRWQEKLVELKARLNRNVTNGSMTHQSFTRLLLGLIELTHSNLEGYRSVCRGVLTAFASTGDPHHAERAIKLCLASPGSGITAAEVEALRAVAHTTGDNPSFRSYYLFSAGLAEYRAGQLDKAIGILAGIPPQHDMSAAASAVLAMIYHQQGKTVEALLELANVPERIANWGTVNGWHDRQLAKLLLQEAEDLIGKGATMKGN